MGASAALLLKDIETFESGVKESVPSAAMVAVMTAKKTYLAAVEDLIARSRDYRTRTEALRAGLERFIVSLAADPAGVDIDEVISTLRSAEHHTKTEMSPYVQKIKSARSQLFSARGLTSGEKARGIAAADMYIAALNDSLTMLRDFRWRIMALRAQVEEVGDAPVFDDPELLIEYLDARSR